MHTRIDSLANIEHLPACYRNKAFLLVCLPPLGLLFNGVTLMQLLHEPEITKLWHACNPGKATKDSQLLPATAAKLVNLPSEETQSEAS